MTTDCSGPDLRGVAGRPLHLLLGQDPAAPPSARAERDATLGLARSRCGSGTIRCTGVASSASNRKTSGGGL
jgi:hypothetical protein